ncbi:putative Glucan endo-1,3-alpha-glucosidase agn1 [Glarea lozoyensis 74030]|uniref:Putative Glucan endo-1,3-alpha-glucosidase agn1 n=1 Tax=Glarea lozoyensis (strain ATCC 74030 / MF5533) TaxID=1104152 RepID=H0EM43_GLAL7|nr:putative Glucan endo-1,3-alpha-glucosidase agn1 [Glarea lozoyensis 74030]
MMAGATQAHLQQDIDDAMGAGFDGFALNIGDPTGSWMTTPLAQLFKYAETKGFKLFFSMDLYAAANACSGGSSGSCGGPNSYFPLLQKYLGSSAWARGKNGLPMISTFSSAGWEKPEWTAWRATLAGQMYFIPDFDETEGYYQAATGWWDYWGSNVEGVFSWDSAWPSGIAGSLSEGDISVDKTVMAGASARGKGYMMPVSSLQYKNANDGPESHYIGNIWPEANGDEAAGKYASQASAPHKAWLPVISSFITAYKSSLPSTSAVPPSSAAAVGAMWYSTILKTASCPSDTKPGGFSLAKDQINWSIVLPKNANGYTVSFTSGSTQLASANLVPGFNYGATSTIKAGAQKMVLKDGSGKTLLTAASTRDVSSGCPDGIYNLNPQVVGLK